MSSTPWSPLDKITDLLAHEPWEIVAPKVDAYLAAGIEAIADVLPTATATTLHEGVGHARTAFETVLAKTAADEGSPDFAAGRLAAALDILAYAGHRSADEGILDLAARRPYAPVLEALAAKPLRNVDLAAQFGWNKGYISKILKELEERDAVTSHRRGRERYNGLTPVGRLVVAKGVEDRARAPLAHSNVHDLDAVRTLYSLASREGPADVTATELTRLDATEAAA